MNAEKLRTIVAKLITDETELGIQQSLNSLLTALTNFSSQPNIPSYQVEVSSCLNTFRTVISQFLSRYDPVSLRRIDEVGATRFFGPELIDTIDKSISENQMTPAVVQQLASSLISQRAEYLHHLKSTLEGLSALGIQPDSAQAGRAEIGFTIPRALFSNELPGLINELAAIRRIIRAFSELATGSVEPIEVHQISTTDPLFFFGLSIITISQIGDAVRWSLKTWKEIEDIRKVRAETMKLASFSSEETALIFDNKIQKTIKQSIDNKARDLTPIEEGVMGRPHEQRTDIAWALESILARVERGMTVEIKFLPSEAPDEKDKNAVEVLRKIVPDLLFPLPEIHPILSLPKLTDSAGGDGI